jgi:hypothetical protein
LPFFSIAEFTGVLAEHFHSCDRITLPNDTAGNQVFLHAYPLDNFSKTVISEEKR